MIVHLVNCAHKLILILELVVADGGSGGDVITCSLKMILCLPDARHFSDSGSIRLSACLISICCCFMRESLSWCLKYVGHSIAQW